MASPGEELPLSNDSSSSMASMAENAQRRFMDSINSAPSLHYNSFKDFARDAVSQYKGYEDAFFLKFKEGFTSVRDSPLPAFGVAIAAGLLLMRGPRRILFRHTLGRLQSEEAQFIRAEKNVKELSLSVDLMKKESRKLLERTALAEKDMKYGHKELIKAGVQIQHLANSVYKVEAQAAAAAISLCLSYSTPPPSLIPVAACCSVFACRCLLFSVRLSLLTVRCSLVAVRSSSSFCRCSLFDVLHRPSTEG